MALAIGQTLQQRYRIQGILGRGGMGVVYQAYDPVLQRTVAIKVLPPQLTMDAEFVVRFQQEAIASANLRHAHIVTVHDVGQQDGEYFIIMEYLEGDTLEQWLASHGPMPAPQAAKVIEQIAAALDHAHSRGIIHRDVKPSNIMLEGHDRAVLMDFGLVRAGEGMGPTRSASVMGTPEYMAPEQVLGQAIDRRTDIYALGVVTFEMLSGRTPFAHTTPLATAHAHAYEAPPPLHSIYKSVSAPVEAVVMKALAKDPVERYQSAGNLARDFAQAVGGVMPAGLLASSLAAGSRKKPSASPTGGGKTLALSSPAGGTPPAPVRPGRRKAGIPLVTTGALMVVAVLMAVLLGLGSGPFGGFLRPDSTAIVVTSTATHTPTQLVGPATLTNTPTATLTDEVALTTTSTVTRDIPLTRSSTATAAATETPTPSHTPTATRANTRTPTPTVTATSGGTTPTVPIASPAPGVLLNFETFGVWARGDEPYGTFTQTGDLKKSGNYAAKLVYDMPAVTDNYVVFRRRPPLTIPGQPDALNMWVYGDGSGHFLNAWIQDARGEVRQFTFGKIWHADSWQQMTLLLDVTAAWPQDHIEGPDNGALDYPIKLFALVLDALPDGTASKGTIYLDDLGTGPGAASPTATPSPDSSPVPPTALPSVAPAALSGRILFTGGNSVSALDVMNGNTWPVFQYGRQPDIRADGRVVVNGVGGGKDNLFAINLDGSGEVMTGLHAEDSYPHWSPSGLSAVFHSTMQGDGRDRIYIQTDMTHSEEPRLLKVGNVDVYGRYPTWLQNWRIAYTGCDYWASGSNCGIWTLDSNGKGNPGQLTLRSDDRTTDSYGDTLLFSSRATGDWEVYAVSVNGGEARNLTNSPSHDMGATFSPDGGSIAFMSNRDGSWGIWVMNADGNNPRRLLQVGNGFGADWESERLAWR